LNVMKSGADIFTLTILVDESDCMLDFCCGEHAGHIGAILKRSPLWNCWCQPIIMR
jgi:hypothetical protein